MNNYVISSLDVNGISDEMLKNHFAVMDEQKKSEILSLPSDVKKKQKIAADMLCRSMISEKCGIAPECIVFAKSENGKPYAVNANVFFSISHSADTVVCAVSEKEIGIDIEKTRNIRLRVAEKFATEAEIGYIGEDIDRFFEIWTLKEAFFKCKGTGLGSDIKSVCFEITEGIVSCSDNGYSLFFEKITDGYTCSVCIKK
jgi:4'-phosphopantetheinyl transferase